jgi:NAD+ kinase
MTARTIHRVGVTLKPTSNEAAELGKTLLAELDTLGIETVLDTQSAVLFDIESDIDRIDLASHVDLIIVLGGDGTLLSVTRGALEGTPILGVNMGSLGFLTEHTAESLLPMLRSTLAGEARLERRERLEVAVAPNGLQSTIYTVLNDAVINKSALARMIVLSLHVNGEFVTRFRADGLIVATPTGSTAYNLSAGGPILYPTLDVVMVTPICPHALTNRPIALSLDSTIEIRLEGPAEQVYLTLDGQQGFPLTNLDVVRLQRCPDPLFLITAQNRSYFQILHRKLKWGERSG